MTEISKAFELALQNRALNNFKAVFSKSLAKGLTRPYQNIPQFANDFPEVTSKNFQSLDPKRQMEMLASRVQTLLDTIIAENTYQAVWVQAYSDNLELFGHSKIVSAFSELSDKDFQTIVEQVVMAHISQYGTPAWIFIAAQRIYEAILAQTLLPKILKVRKEEKDTAFITAIDKCVAESVSEAFVTFLDLANKCGYELFRKLFVHQLIIELIGIYKEPKDRTYLNDVVKKVFNLVIRIQ